VFLQTDTVIALRADVDRLTSELKTSEQDRASLTDTVDRLNRELTLLRQPTTTGAVSETEVYEVIFCK